MTNIPNPSQINQINKKARRIINVPEPRNVIFHEIKVAQPFSPANRQNFAPTKIEKEFWNKVFRKYFFDSAKTFGKFNQTPTDSFETYLKNYLNNNDFLNFSIQSSSKLIDEMKIARNTTDGFLFFTDFSYENKRYILLLLLKDANGFKFNGGVLVNAPHLDLRNIHFASLVNLTDWKKNSPSNTYLTVVKGGARSKVSDYFIKFTGIKETYDSTETSELFIKALKTYARRKFLSIPERNKFLANAISQIEKFRAGKKEFDLRKFCEALQSDKRRANGLMNFMQTKFNVNSHFTFATTCLKRLKFHSYSKDNLKISFPVAFKQYEVNLDKSELTLKIEDKEFLKLLDGKH